MSDQAVKKTNSLAITSLVTGLIGPLFTFIFGIHSGGVVHSGGYFILLIGIAALVAGFLALGQIGKRSDTEKRWRRSPRSNSKPPLRKAYLSLGQNQRFLR